MVIKITPQQARVNALLRKLCANYDGGNCLPLDDGEGCVCVQMISYSLLCRYFRRAVLPADKALCADIYRQRTRTCERCGKPFAPSSNRPGGGAASNIKRPKSLDFQGFWDSRAGVGGRFHPSPPKSTSNILQRRILWTTN